jgi:DNA-binding PadR family transcriptional regulator
MDLASRPYWTRAVNAALCRMLILQEVCLLPGHGYDLIKRIDRRTRGTFHPTQATVYPTLAELERSGCLVATTARTGRRVRHVYAVTPKGRQACQFALDAWRSGLRAALRAAPVHPSA